MSYKEFFTDPKGLSVNCFADETLVGVANAECDGDAIMLTFIGVRDTHQKRGIAAGMMARLIVQARTRGLRRLIGKDIKSRASLRLLERQLGPGAIQGDGVREKLPEQPDRVIFAPSFGMLTVESEHQLTVEWAL